MGSVQAILGRYRVLTVKLQIGLRAAHSRLVRLDCGSTSQSLMMPDMSLPLLVRLLLARLQVGSRRKVGSRCHGVMTVREWGIERHT